MTIHKLLMAVGVACMTAACTAPKDTMAYKNTWAIAPNDSREVIMAKAVHVVPTANQMAALQNEFIAFIHFGPNTFTRMEWGNGKEDPRIFDLKTLDTDQWCAAMQAAGMKMVIFTAKHHDGFVLWQSRYTRHGIMSTGFRDGKGDVLKDLSASCRKYGLKLGIYLSPADLYQIENAEGLYGNLSAKTLRTIPQPVEGRPFADKRTFQFVVDDYNAYFLNQLFELLTEYGPIHEVWFDGAHPKRKGGQTYDYASWKTLIPTLAPEAVIFGREDVRWCGNEAGGTRPTEWNVMPYAVNPDTATHFADITDADPGSDARLLTARYLHYQQAETNTSIREGWFYRDDDRQQVRSADDVFDIYERAVGGNATFLLNIPPDRDGRFGDRDVAVLTEVGQRIHATYGTDLMAGAKGPRALLDGKAKTAVSVKDGVVLQWPEAITFNRIVLQEPIAQSGERVAEHAVDAWVDGAWKEVAHATNIGYKRILRLPDVTTDKVRIRVLSARAEPRLSHVSLHHYAARPPMLTCRRTKDGKVVIAPKPQDFGWKANGEALAANLSAGYEIRYTTDGTAPGAQAALYTAPFAADACVVKAVALLNGERGAVLTEQLGTAKTGWHLVSATGEQPRHTAAMAFDEDPATWWAGDEGTQHALVWQLEQPRRLSGFAYTPPRRNAEGMMAGGKVWVSMDGSHWTEAATFHFGNLINDPTRRSVDFATPVEARYVKVQATEIAGGGKRLCIAEVDVW